MDAVERRFVFTKDELLKLDPIEEYQYLTDHNDNRSLYFSYAVFLIAQERDRLQQSDTWVDELSDEIRSERPDKDKTTQLWSQVVSELFANTGADAITITAKSR
jgi:hypothetical protein